MSVVKDCSAALSVGAALWASPSHAGTLTTLYSFENVASSVSDGASPVTGLATVGTTILFGSASAGGSSASQNTAGYGLAFEANLAAPASVTYSQTCNFAAGNGFGTPMGDLVPATLSSSSGTSAVLLGAMSHLPDPTSGSGPTDYGGIFSCNQTLAAAPTVLTNFGTSNLDTIGGLPSGNLVAEFSTSGGYTTLEALYGTARIGGAGNSGSVTGSNTSTTTSYLDTGGTIYVYAPALSSVPTVVHSFGLATVSGPGGTQADGVEPVGGLVSNGQSTPTFYGTTAAGGTNGYGTIFACTPSTTGSVTSCSGYAILYNFGGGADGMAPAGPLLYVSAGTGTLYGTTSNAGTNGGGTLFELSPPSGTGTFTTLSSFPSANTGALHGTGSNPGGDLALHGNDLYGTTWQGGTLTPVTGPVPGEGTIYKFNTATSAFTTEHTFVGPVDGGSPFGGLDLIHDSAGTFYYGTTHGGGCGNGTLSNSLTCSAGSSVAGVPGSGTIFVWSP